MKRGGFLNHHRGFGVRRPLKRSILKQLNESPSAIAKREIQSLVRRIVILRDGGCILRNLVDAPPCSGWRKDGQLVLQADHLITRANSSTYADTRLVVCVCKGHHGWKKYNKEQYDDVVSRVLSPERVLLWEGAMQDSWRPARRYSADWELSIVLLKRELFDLHEGTTEAKS